MIDPESGITSTYYYDFIDRLCHYTEEAEGYSLALKYTFGEMDEVTQIQEIRTGDGSLSCPKK